MLNLLVPVARWLANKYKSMLKFLIFWLAEHEVAVAMSSGSINNIGNKKPVWVALLVLIIAGPAAICMTFLPSPVSLANSDPLAALIARARGALGPGFGKVHSIYISASVEADGINGTFQEWVEPKGARYAQIIDLGPLSQSEGYDGSIGWWRDSKGIVLPQTAPGGRAWTADQIFNVTKALFKPNYGGAAVSYLDTRTDAGKTYEAIKVQAPDGYPAEDWYDAETALLARHTVTIAGRTTTTYLSHYRSVGNLMIAHQIDMEKGSAFKETIKVNQVRTDVPDLEEHLRRPVSVAKDFSLPGGQTTIPFKYVDNHISIDVYLNGKGPFAFWLDTGGINVTDPTVAWQIGAHSIGTSRQGGIGPGSTAAEFAKVNEVSIGNAKINDLYFKVIQIQRPFGLQVGLAFHAGAQGLIGWELLARFVTIIDYAGGKLILRTPTAAASAPPSQTSVPLLFDRGWPEFACRIGGANGTCLIDTGFWGTVAVTSPFVQAHQNIVPQFSDGSGIGYGFGGTARGSRGSLGSFQMGSITLTNLDAAYSSDEKGGLAVPFLAGIVGNQVLNRFRLTLDYSRARMGLERNGGLDEQ